MVHLADKSYPTKEFTLDENFEFISLVDSSQTRHNCDISVLIFDKAEQRMKIKVYIYKNPFEMKDFTSDENWITDQDIEIEENVSKFMIDVLYPRNFQEAL